MANLSNINNILRTNSTGVGIFADAGSYPLEISSAGTAGVKLINTAGATYDIYANASEEFIIAKNGVGDRLTISSGGDATFTGNVGIAMTAGTISAEIKGRASDGKSLRLWDNGGTDILDLYNNGTNAYINTTHSGGAGNPLIIQTNSVTALTLDTSQNATFAGQVLCDTNTTTPAGGEAVFYKSSAGAVLSGYQAILETGSGGSRATALTLDNSQNATFGGGITMSDSILISYTGSDGMGRDAGLKVINDSSDWGVTIEKGINNYGLKIKSDGLLAFGLYNSSNVNKISFTGTGNATFAGSVEGTTARFDTLNNKANSANIIYRSGTNTVVGNNASALVVQDGGNVGIGTTSPSQKLHIYDGAGGGSAPDSRTKLLIEDNGEAYLAFNVPAASYQGIRFSQAGAVKALAEYYGTANSLHIGTIDSTGTLEFHTTNSVKMTILANGNVGIGTSSPASKLHVLSANGDVTLDSGTGATHSITLSHKGSYAELNGIEFAQGSTTYGNNQIKFLNMNSVGTVVETMRINGAGNVGIGTTGPTAKLHIISSVPECAIFDTTSASYGAMNVFRSQGVTKGNAGYNSGSMYFGGEAGVNTIIQSGGQTGIFINNSTRNVGIGTTVVDALLTMKDAENVQQWDRAKGFFQHTTQTGSAAGNFNISTIINTHNLRGLTVDYYESGHYYNNGATTYFRHTRLYIMIESSTLRVGTSVLIQSLGSATGAIVSAPTVTASGTHEATIVSTILSGYTHYVSVDVVGSGFKKIVSIS